LRWLIPNDPQHLLDAPWQFQHPSALPLQAALWINRIFFQDFSIHPSRTAGWRFSKASTKRARTLSNVVSNVYCLPTSFVTMTQTYSIVCKSEHRGSVKITSWPIGLSREKDKGRR
jgi:hypothetical protein